jgi:hypothetical protein
MSKASLPPELASALSEIEQSFFQRGDSEIPVAAESFDDLDDGYRPVGFWSRLFRAPRPR